MNNVRVLPPEIISKIAAGEVIDRPASVIKELLENSIDAGATTVELQLEQAGKTLIKIKDNGSGITPDDLEHVFQRHATSKIATIDDLFQITSLGFRGEALYSISAIADIILRSRTSGQDNGWEIHVRGGERINLKPCAMATGTEIEVKELFFNTPARRKFLKTNTTEVNQTLNVFIPYTLLYPNKRFLLTHQGKALLDLAAQEDLSARAAEVLNLDETHLLEAETVSGDGTIKARMLIGDINISRSRRDMQFVFINNRPVQSKSISFHMNNVYRLILPQGSFPFFLLFVDIPAEDVDANIHPTKREVKIRDEQPLCALLRRTCEELLMTQGKPKAFEAAGGLEASTPLVDRALSRSSREDLSFEVPEAADQPARSSSEAKANPSDQYTYPRREYFSPEGQPLTGLAEQNLFHGPAQSLKEKLLFARFVGNFINKYLLFESEKSLLCVDQHAAQERITFEKLIVQMQKGQLEIQHLLSPYTLRISRQDMTVWEESKDKLESIGLGSTLFDDETIAIHTYPVLLQDPVKVMQDILAGDDAAQCDHESLARRACRSSVMAGERLTREQAEFQRQELLKCRDPFTCPHGRPTVIEIKETELNKQFLRI